MDVIALGGVEVTHVPPKAIPQVVKAARRAGAEIVVVHGETLAEPVIPGTNAAALSLPEVDILAHPGFLTVEEADAAKAHDIFIEITARKGHALANGHVARVLEKVGGKPILNSDTHDPGDLITQEKAEDIARGAGFSEDYIRAAILHSPRELLKRVGKA
jgi:histidinol phosphatase-like PHP family hydrolase